MNKNDLKIELTIYKLGKHALDILDCAISSLRMKTVPTNESKIRLGKTKMGGCPDLPENISWPEYNGKPLHFLCQIDLLASFCCGKDIG